MNLFVGNLSRNVTENEVHTLFSSYGKVINVNLAKDKYSGKLKGFGFVELEKQIEAEQAIKQLSDYVLDGRAIVVNAVRPIHGDLYST